MVDLLRSITKFCARRNSFTLSRCKQRSPKIEGLLTGDFYQLEAKSVTLDKSARIDGTWYVPGSPRLVLKGGTLQSGSIVEGTGSQQPSGYEIKLEDNSFAKTIVNRTRLTLSDLPEVIAFVPGSGTRKVDIKKSSDSIGDPSTIEDLHMHLGRGERGKKLGSLPGGAYGKMSVPMTVRWCLALLVQRNRKCTRLKNWI